LDIEVGADILPSFHRAIPQPEWWGLVSRLLGPLTEKNVCQCGAGLMGPQPCLHMIHSYQECQFQLGLRTFCKE
jgi:hypothetical protein